MGNCKPSFVGSANRSIEWFISLNNPLFAVRNPHLSPPHSYNWYDFLSNIRSQCIYPCYQIQFRSSLTRNRQLSSSPPKVVWHEYEDFDSLVWLESRENRDSSPGGMNIEAGGINSPILLGRKKIIEYWVFLVIKSRFPCLGSIPGRMKLDGQTLPFFRKKKKKK